MSEDYEGTEQQIKKLRSWLRSLKARGLSAEKIILEGDIPYQTSSLNRFRNGAIERIRDNAGKKLWGYVLERHPGIFHGPVTEHEEQDQFDLLFSNVKQFFELKNKRIDDFISDFSGTYAMYSRSSNFYKMGCYIVSKLEISKTESNSISILESQTYSGRLGLSELRENFHGFCIPKSGIHIIVATETERHHPRIYFLNDMHFNEDRSAVEFFQGYFVTYSKGFGGYFQSNFFCKRLQSGDHVDYDIFERVHLQDKIVENWIYSSI
ncbi:hypothetical protein [Stappia stellulata]|uniref:hypothetical protein n=1 Tax=Stappia stellulata TaxID=71235 RepID=UPI0012EB48CF|nr:hypothetical protein [Stappia stellulata]